MSYRNFKNSISKNHFWIVKKICKICQKWRKFSKFSKKFDKICKFWQMYEHYYQLSNLTVLSRSLKKVTKSPFGELLWKFWRFSQIRQIIFLTCHFEKFDRNKTKFIVWWIDWIVLRIYLKSNFKNKKFHQNFLKLKKSFFIAKKGNYWQLIFD